MTAALPGFGAGGFEQRAKELLPVYDHLGNAVTVTNQFDGNQYFVQITQLNRQGAAMRNLKMIFQDKNHFTEKWTFHEKDKEDVITFQFTKKKPSIDRKA